MLHAGVMGDPVAHSLSPRLHSYWLKQYGIDGDYTALQVPPAQLKTALRALGEEKFRGVNLTVPHKEAALEMMDEVDATARAIGAVNTVVVQDGKLSGTNTDAYGFITNLKHSADISALPNRRALVLGAGGAARAVVYGLRGEGLDVTLCNRSADRAKSLATQFSASHESWEKRDAGAPTVGLVVNTTTLGMPGQPPLEISLSMPKGAAVMDLVYRPLETPLLKQARAKHYIAIDGLGMLLHQAVPGFAAWFGVTPEVTPALRDAMLAAL